MGVPIWPAAGLFAWGYQGAPWSSYKATGTVTGATVTLDAGWWMVVNGAHNTCQGVVSSGTTTATFIAASKAGLVFSDGNSTIIVNDSTGGTAASYAKIHGVGP